MQRAVDIKTKWGPAALRFCGSRGFARDMIVSGAVRLPILHAEVPVNVKRVGPPISDAFERFFTSAGRVLMGRMLCSLFCTVLLFGWPLFASATPYAWGDNSGGQLGNKSTGGSLSVPAPVSGLGEVLAVAGGKNHSLALLADGTVRAWGVNSSGQLGDGTTTARTTPVPVSGLGGVVAIAGGYDHSLALLTDGTVRAWGWNYYGQLGDGTTTSRLTPVPVSGLSGVVAIAGGGNHSLALLADGTVRTWGNNYYGQLGDWTSTDRLTPVPVSGLSGVVAIAGGGNHSLALLADGTVRTWGYNTSGQLGDGTTNTHALPVPVSGLSGVVAIAGGGNHSLVLLADGTVRAWGHNYYGQLGDGTSTNRLTSVPVSGLSGVVAIAGGGNHSLAVFGDGTVRAWGQNSYSQLGDGTVTARSTPVPVSGINGVKAIAGGYNHNLVIFSEDDLMGAVGIRATPYRHTASTTAATTAADDPTPSCVSHKPSNTVWYSFQAVTAGRLSVTTTGSDYDTVVAIFTGPRYNLTEQACSNNAAGTPQSVVTDLMVTAGTLYFIEVGSYSPGGGSLVLNASFSPSVSSGTLRVWGGNDLGQFGDGTTTARPTPDLVGGVGDVKSIAGGGAHSLALLTDGTVRAWGDNEVGQLGNGAPVNRSTPVPVTGLSGVVAIAAGSAHSLALLADGTVRTWGYNDNGQLGDGTTTARTTPVPVSGLSGVVAIAGGFEHSLALLADGTVRAWGQNSYGQLGDGTTTNRITPVPVTGLGGVVAIAGGESYSLALLNDGSVRAWGQNSYGQLGDGTTTARTTPVPVSGLSGVVAITAGESHNLALLTDTSVRAWGYNANGQLGDGTRISRSTPVPVSGLSGVAAIAGGWEQSFAILTDGSVRAWGDNSYAQLGDGTTTDRLTPVSLSGLSGVVALAGGYQHSLALIAKLSISKTGVGNGTVTSTPSGLSCRGTCTLEPSPGGGVILTATPDPGSVFSGWSGACTGTAHCILDVTGGQSVQARFNPAPLPQVHLGLSAAEYSVGDPMTVTATVTPGSPVFTDVYVAVDLPEAGLLFLNATGGLSHTPAPFKASWLVGPSTGTIFSHSFSGTEPAGTYRWLAALMAPGSLTPLTGISEAPVSVWPAPTPALRLYLNAMNFRPGGPLRVGLSLDEASTILDRDVYVALQLPDGSLLFLDEAGQATPTATPHLRHWAGTATTRKMFEYSFTGGEPGGAYKWLTAFAEPGTLNLIGPLVVAPFSFAP